MQELRAHRGWPSIWNMNPALDMTLILLRIQSLILLRVQSWRSLSRPEPPTGREIPSQKLFFLLASPSLLKAGYFQPQVTSVIIVDLQRSFPCLYLQDLGCPYFLKKICPVLWSLSNLLKSEGVQRMPDFQL